MKYALKPLAALSLSLLLATACNNRQQPSQNDIATPVSVLELKKGPISKRFNTTASALAAASADLNAQTGGAYRLQTNPKSGAPYRLGDAVAKGAVVVRLEDAEYENGIAIESKRLGLELAEQKLTKQQALYEKGGATQNDIRNTEVEITNARYSYENARLSLEKLNVRAPFDGVIVSLPHYTPGVRIEQGKPVVSLMDYAQLYLEVNLPESAIPYVKTGQPVQVTHYTLPGDTLSGEVRELSPAVSVETRTFKGKIAVRNEALKLHPGMFVKADIVVEKADSALIVPKRAVQSDGPQRYVYIVDKENASYRRLRTGIEDEENMQVLDGLKEGDKLIVKGFETLRDGSKVKVQK